MISDEKMATKRRKCRLWWPTNLCSTASSQPNNSHSFTFFFGWFIFSKSSSSSSEPSLDVVVAFALDEPALSSVNLQGVLDQTNGNMPLSLQDQVKFSFLGYCGADFTSNGPSLSACDRDEHVKSTNELINCLGTGDSGDGKNVNLACGCHKVDGLLERLRLTCVQNDNWFQLVYSSPEITCQKWQLVPKLHHIHWNGEIVSQLDLHSSLEQERTHTKKPKWVEDLEQKQPDFDLDVVIRAINCVNAAQLFSERHLPRKKSIIPFNFLCVSTTFTWKLFAALVASFSTLVYIILQTIHVFLRCLSGFYVYNALANLFHNTRTIIERRCCQFLYWPIFLQSFGLRSQSCVEYAEKVALRRHSTWSSLVVDVLLGNLFGIALWSHGKPACLWMSNFADDITNYLLRSGCVWLMGNPAGFKLNTELAGVLGMMALNMIQIWSTLWSFMGFLFIQISKVIALSGVFFGLTTAAALIIDMISLLTRHVFILHWLLSLLYSRQIQALAALWRLFRGKKWNPLRQRLDSFDYTVEQHVVGSLLFTPMLLLLPTTSAFYIFFAILNTAVSFICLVIEVSICVIHATPYNKIFLWMVRKRRFPAGIWFRFASSQHNSICSSMIGPVDFSGSSSRKSPKSDKSSGSESTILVSVLHSNYMNLGELVGSYYGFVYSAISSSSITLLAYGLLTGKRIPSGLGAVLPSRLPWMVRPWKDYWCLCYDAVFACREN